MSDSLSFSLLYRRVLIDTWWNVNRIEFVQNLVCNSSFNRYMVECEYYLLDCFAFYYQRFNRYMVECECRRLSYVDLN